MAKRPYFKSGINELESLVEKHWNDIDTLKSIANELEYRKSKRAIQLATKVKEHLSGSSPLSSGSRRQQANTTSAKKSTKTSKKSSSKEATGTTPFHQDIFPEQERATQNAKASSSSRKGNGKGTSATDHAEKKRNQTHFEESADIIQNFINALAIEVAAIKKTSQEASIELRGG